jgi:hypothetical protein
LPKDGDWTDIVLQLPKALLAWAGILVCIAFTLLIIATIDSTYRTKVPFKVAGFLFGYAADEPTEVEKLKTAVNEQLEKLKSGVVDDHGPQGTITNSSSKNGAGASSNGQGHCPSGEMIVGLQPLASSEGASLTYLCGKLPELKVK